MDIQPLGPFGSNLPAAASSAGADAGMFAVTLATGVQAAAELRSAGISGLTAPTTVPPMLGGIAPAASSFGTGRAGSMSLLLAGAATAAPGAATLTGLAATAIQAQGATELLAPLQQTASKSPGPAVPGKSIAEPAEAEDLPPAGEAASVTTAVPSGTQSAADIQSSPALELAPESGGAAEPPSNGSPEELDRRLETTAGLPASISFGEATSPEKASSADGAVPALPKQASPDAAPPMPVRSPEIPVLVHTAAPGLAGAGGPGAAASSPKDASEGGTAGKRKAGAGSSTAASPAELSPPRISAGSDSVRTETPAADESFVPEGQGESSLSARAGEFSEPAVASNPAERADAAPKTDKSQVQPGDAVLRALPSAGADRGASTAVLQTAIPSAAAAPPAAAPLPQVSDMAANGPMSESQPVLEARAGQLGRDMGVEIARRISAGIEELVIRLDPAELGRISIRMSVNEQGSLRAVLAADAPAALEVLRHEIGDLGRALEQAGVRTDSDSLRFDRGQGGENNSAWQRYQGPDRGARSGGAAADPMDQPEQVNVRTSGRVDLMA